MKPEVAKLWAADLRKHKDQQGRGLLAAFYPDRVGGPEWAFCCLGRLCELAVEHGVKLNRVDYQSAYGIVVRGYNDQKYDLPSEVAEWAGMHTPTGRIRLDENRSPENDLQAANDTGNSFENIANMIELHQEEL